MEKILVSNNLGGAFKVENGELLTTPLLINNTFDNLDWCEVSDFYPNVVEEVNKVFGTEFESNIPETKVIFLINERNND